VLGLEVVLANGNVLSELKGLRKDNSGYDLRNLFIGAEGTLGVITAAVLKLVPAPVSRQTAWLAVASVDAALRLLGDARRRTGDQVVSAEYLSRQSLELVLAHVPGVRDPLVTTHAHYVLLELAGSVDDAALHETLERLLAAGIEAGTVVDGVIAASNQQRDALWKLRETIPEAEGREARCVKHDVSVPLGSIPAFLVAARARLTAVAEHRLSVFGHLGDGNLHYNLVPARDSKFEGSVALELTQALYELVEEFGGSFSAEHGIGIFRRDDLERYKSQTALDLMRRIKRALDPHGIMNPGKVLAPLAQGAPET
jgi:FAD/FMN-containing dehydrogenase